MLYHCCCSFSIHGALTIIWVYGGFWCLVLRVVSFIQFDVKTHFRIITALQLWESLLMMEHYQSVGASVLLMCSRLAVNWPSARVISVSLYRVSIARTIITAATPACLHIIYPAPNLTAVPAITSIWFVKWLNILVQAQQISRGFCPCLVNLLSFRPSM